jgi:hypothetical protein
MVRSTRDLLQVPFNRTACVQMHQNHLKYAQIPELHDAYTIIPSLPVQRAERPLVLNDDVHVCYVAPCPSTGRLHRHMHQLLLVQQLL